MEERNDEYSEDEIIHLEFDNGDNFDCGIMGTFEAIGKEYIALEALDGTGDIYLYGYKPTEGDFELLDIPDEEFDEVSAEFDRIMDEPV